MPAIAGDAGRNGDLIMSMLLQRALSLTERLRTDRTDSVMESAGVCVDDLRVALNGDLPEHMRVRVSNALTSLNEAIRYGCDEISDVYRADKCIADYYHTRKDRPMSVDTNDYHINLNPFSVRVGELNDMIANDADPFSKLSQETIDGLGSAMTAYHEAKDGAKGKAWDDFVKAADLYEAEYKAAIQGGRNHD